MLERHVGNTSPDLKDSDCQWSGITLALFGVERWDCSALLRPHQTVSTVVMRLALRGVVSPQRHPYFGGVLVIRLAKTACGP